MDDNTKAAKAEPVAWPKTAQQIREFVGANFISYEGDDTPLDTDRYWLTAHDLLSAFDDWGERTQPAPDAKAEPVAWMYTENDEIYFGGPHGYYPDDARPLYLAPPAPDGIDWDRIAALQESLREHMQIIADLRESHARLVGDAARYRAFFDAGLPVSFLGTDYWTKAELDAAIDAAMNDKEQP